MTSTTSPETAAVPLPVRHATYPGDARHMIGEVKGPTTIGERLAAVTATYDADAGTTRVGFTFAALSPAQAATAREEASRG